MGVREPGEEGRRVVRVGERGREVGRDRNLASGVVGDNLDLDLLTPPDSPASYPTVECRWSAVAVASVASAARICDGRNISASNAPAMAIALATLMESAIPATNEMRTESAKVSRPACFATANPAKTLDMTASAADWGRPATWTWLWYVAMRTLPRIAAPNGAPSLEIAWSSPPPTPAWSARNWTNAAELAVASSIPAPAPAKKV
jgi:hypothetical protein